MALHPNPLGIEQTTVCSCLPARESPLEKGVGGIDYFYCDPTSCRWLGLGEKPKVLIIDFNNNEH
ncbi:hypothetical protein CN271_22335 [Bacillus cereus]|nr:hypothetical protein CON59_20085 [Bacillus cereus]PFD66529.1 hypothetical protein CN271_22335 [Bacillus cereus]PGP66989.1 hypothetical protein COA00_20950 [Bacillus cereus]PGU39800.1 hypothetical protein COD64_32740 [Bacillus cereus]